MKKYKQYMDTIKASDTLHQRLVRLEEPEKRPVSWKKYGSLAAALALVCGLGAWGLGKSGGWARIAAQLQNDVYLAPSPEIVEAAQEPDIAIVDPNEVEEPGEKTLGGYDVTYGSGSESVAAHYVLPYIEYGGVEGAAMSLDWDVPQGASRRDLSRDEILTLLGGEEAVSVHLDWSAYELTGWAAWYGDGAFWGAYVYGYEGPMDHFEFAATAGELPPTCIIFPASVTQEVRGLTVTADGYDGEQGGTRRVSFMKDEYGYRFDLTSTDTEQAELLVSRLVSRIADEGLALTYTCPYCGHTFPFGAVHNDPYIGAEEVYTCPDCGQTFQVDDMRAHVHSFKGVDGTGSTAPYDPREAVDPQYHAPAASADPEDDLCAGYPVPDPAESWDICGLPLAPDVQ